MRRVASLLLALAATAAPALASPFGKAPVSDADLGEMRGGFLLPGGLDVSIAVQSSTSVNGTPLLRTIFTAGGGGASLSVFGQGEGGLTPVNLSGNTGQTSSGNVRVEGSGSGSQVILSAPAIDIRHLAGSAYGSIIANRADDVVIDTDTVIDIQLGNATPLNIGSSMLRVDALAGDITGRLVR